MPRLFRVLLGVAALWLWQSGLSLFATSALGAPPGPVPGFLALALLLLAAHANETTRPLGERVLQALAPAETALLRDLPLLFAPALIVVLLRPLPGVRELVTLIALVVGLALLTILASARLLQRLLRGQPPLTLQAEPPAPAVPGWSRLGQVSLLGLALLLAASHRWLVELRGPPLAFGVGLTATLAGWQIGRALPRTVQRWLPPLVLVSVVGAGGLWLGQVSATSYLSRSPVGAGGALLWLLGPAVQALALGLVRRFAVVRQRALAVLLPVVVVAGLSLVVSAWLAAAVGISREWGLPMALRSVTSAVGLSLATALAVDPARAAAGIVVTGVLVAQAGPALLTRLGCRDPVARGVALGIAGHGLAAAALLRTEPLAGTVASLVFGLMAVATALWLPLLGPWLWPG